MQSMTTASVCLPIPQASKQLGRYLRDYLETFSRAYWPGMIRTAPRADALPRR